jgi:hypothetical protein
MDFGKSESIENIDYTLQTDHLPMGLYRIVVNIIQFLNENVFCLYRNPTRSSFPNLTIPVVLGFINLNRLLRPSGITFGHIAAQRNTRPCLLTGQAESLLYRENVSIMIDLF